MARPTPTWVYAITCGEHTKIGIATDVPARLRGLQGSNPYPVKVYGTRLFESYSTARLIEMELHREFAEHRGYGEWFKIDPETVMASLRGWEEYQPEPLPGPTPVEPMKPVPQAKPKHFTASQWRILKALEF
jgi:hypothetical protein